MHPGGPASFSYSSIDIIVITVVLFSEDKTSYWFSQLDVRYPQDTSLVACSELYFRVSYKCFGRLLLCLKVRFNLWAMEKIFYSNC